MEPSQEHTATHDPRAATILLVLVTAFWGLSFPLNKVWQKAAAASLDDEILSSLTIVALRMLLALVLLTTCKPALLRATRRELACGGLIGLVFFLGFILQIWAMTQPAVTPALSAFLTSLACVWTPLLAWGVFGIALQRALLPGLGLAMIGTTCLSWQPGEALVLGSGELATLIASFLFACQILLLDRLGRTVRSGTLTVGFLAVAGLIALTLAATRAAAGPGLVKWLQWVWVFHHDLGNLLVLGLLVLLCTVLSFHWMNIFQPQVSAARAALIYLLEALFAAVFSMLWGLDQVTAQLFVGGALILAGNAMVELWGRSSLQEL